MAVAMTPKANKERTERVRKIRSRGGYVILNKRMVKELGLIKAGVFAFMCDKWFYTDGEPFYFKLDDLVVQLKLGKSQVRNAIHDLIEAGLLINLGLRGVPAKQYYDIEVDKIEEKILAYEDDNVAETDSQDIQKSEQEVSILNDSIHSKNESLYNNKNKLIKTDDNNKKEKSIKKKKIESTPSNEKSKELLKEYAINLWHEKKKDYPNLLSLSKWEEWVNYRLDRHKASSVMFDSQMKKIIYLNADDCANAIDSSIMNYYQGVFFDKINNYKNNKQPIVKQNNINQSQDIVFEYKNKKIEAKNFKLDLKMYLDSFIEKQTLKRAVKYIVDSYRNKCPDFANQYTDDQLFGLFTEKYTDKYRELYEKMRNEVAQEQDSNFRKYLSYTEKEIYNAISSGELDTIVDKIYRSENA